MIRFQCPSCRAVLQVPPHLGGQVVACSQCKGSMRVPAAPARSAPPPPPPPPPSRRATPPKRGSALGPVLAVAAGFLVLAIGVGVGYLVMTVRPRTPDVGKKEPSPPPPPKGAPDDDKKPPVVAPPLEKDRDKGKAPAPGDVPRALALLNAERKAAKVPPLQLDEPASERCRAAARAVASGEALAVVYEQLPDAGLVRGTAHDAMTGWLKGPLHRDLLLARARKSIGIGTARDAAGQDVTVISGLHDTLFAVGTTGAVTYPPHGLHRVPLLFPGNEVPDPLPDLTDKLAGYPITVTFPRSHRVADTEAVMEDEQGRPVPVHASGPDRPANKAFGAYQQNTICVFAHAPLRPGTRYLIRARGRVDGRPWGRLWSFVTRPAEEGTPRMIEGALKQLNAFRVGCGLSPVTADAAMSKACQAHANYLARHLDRVKDLKINEQDESLPGFTKEGHEIAARSAVRLGGGAGPADAVDWLMTSVLNRNLVLNPSLKSIGLGAAVQSPRGWIWVLHLPGRRNSGDGPPVLFPAPDQKEVPLFFARDPREMVADAPKGGRAGFPITVSFFPLDKVTEVTAGLKDDRGADVELWLSTPEKRLPGTGTYSQVVMLPRQPLRAAAAYTAEVTAEVNGRAFRRQWRFTTLDPSGEEARVGAHLLAELNAFRRQAGLDEVTMDEELSKGCRLHAEYVMRNIDDPKVQGLNIHDEDPSLPGYTKEGQKAGRASVIAIVSEPADSVAMWMATLYHRIPLLSPGLKRIGYGQRQHPTRGWVTVLDSGSGR